MYNIQPTKSSNYFGDLRIDRLANLRKDRHWFRLKLESIDSIIIPVVDSKVLVQKENPQVLAKFSIKDFPDNDFQDFILLGEMNHHTYFALGKDQLIPAANCQLFDLKSIAAILDREESSLLAYAIGIVNWQKGHIFCGVCGSLTKVDEAGHQRTCKNVKCGNKIFPRTDPAIITMVINGNSCLLGRNNNWPDKVYSTLAGFVEPGESLEEAVRREVFEESGIIIGKVNYHSSQPWPFPSSIMLGFISQAKSTALQIDRDELSDARWFDKSQLRALVKKREIVLPNKYSIAYRLVSEWLYG